MHPPWPTRQQRWRWPAALASVAKILAAAAAASVVLIVVASRPVLPMEALARMGKGHAVPRCADHFLVPGLSEATFGMTTAEGSTVPYLRGKTGSYCGDGCEFFGPLAHGAAECAVPPPRDFDASRTDMTEWKVPLGNVQAELVRSLEHIKGKQRWVDVDRKAGVVKLPKGSTCGDVSNIAELVRHVAAVGGTVAPGARAATLLDMGCGVASLDAAVADKGAATNDTLAMHIHGIGVAPIDQHFGQTQLVAERGVPLLVGAVTPLWRLPFPMGAFDLVYCCWCRLSGEAVAVQVAQLLKAGGHFIIDDQGEHVSLVLGREPMRFCLERVEVPREMLAGLPREMVVFRRMPSAECQEAQARVVGGAVPLPPCEPSALLGGDGTVQACLPELGEDGLRAAAAPANGAGAVMLPAAALAWLSARAPARVLLIGDDGSIAAQLADAGDSRWQAITVVSPARRVARAMAGGFVGYTHNWCLSLPNHARAYDGIVVLLDAEGDSGDDGGRLLDSVVACTGGAGEAGAALAREIARLLRPGGALYARFPTAGGGPDALRAAAAIVDDLEWLERSDEGAVAGELRVLFRW